MADNKVQITITAEDLASGIINGVEQSLAKTGNSFKDLLDIGAHASQVFSAFTGAVSSVISPLVDAALQAEKLNAMFNAASGSSILAGRDMAFAKDEATRLGLALVPTAESFAKFTAAAKGSSLQGDALKKVFSGVAEASAAMRLSTDETNGIFLALSQMMSKGTVQAEELKGQLGERLPGAFQMAAKAMGLTTAELQKQLEVGGVMASDLLPKLADELHNTYGAESAKSAHSLQGEMNLLANAIKSAGMEFGQMISPTLASGLQLVRESLGGIATTAEVLAGVAIAGTLGAWGRSASVAASSFLELNLAVQSGTATMLGSAEATAAKNMEMWRLARANVQAAESELAVVQGERAHMLSLQTLNATIAEELIFMERLAVADAKVAAGAVIVAEAKTLESAASVKAAASMAAATAATTVTTVAMGLASKAGAVLSGVMSAMGGPIGLALAAAMGVMAWLNSYGKKVDEQEKAVLDSYHKTQAAGEEATRNAESRKKRLEEALTPNIDEKINKIGLRYTALYAQLDNDENEELKKRGLREAQRQALTEQYSRARVDLQKKETDEKSKIYDGEWLKQQKIELDKNMGAAKASEERIFIIKKEIAEHTKSQDDGNREIAQINADAAKAKLDAATIYFDSIKGKYSEDSKEYQDALKGQLTARKEVSDDELKVITTANAAKKAAYADQLTSVQNSHKDDLNSLQEMENAKTISTADALMQRLKLERDYADQVAAIRATELAQINPETQAAEYQKALTAKLDADKAYQSARQAVLNQEAKDLAGLTAAHAGELQKRLEAEKAAIVSTQAMASSWFATWDNAYNSAAASLTALSDAAYNTFATIEKLPLKTADSLGSLSQKADEAARSYVDLYRAAETAGLKSGAAWHDAVTALNMIPAEAARITAEYYKQAAAAETLATALEDPANVTEAFASQAERATDNLNLLNQASLDKLKGGIDKIKNAMLSFTDQVKASLKSLQDDWDNMSMSKVQLEEKRYQDQKTKWQEDYKTAQAQQNAEAIAALNQELSLIDKIHAANVEDLKTQVDATAVKTTSNDSTSGSVVSGQNQTPASTQASLMAAYTNLAGILYKTTDMLERANIQSSMNNVSAEIKKVLGMATGGNVGGSGTGDTQLRWLDPREWVMRPEAVSHWGGNVMAAMNNPWSNAGKQLAQRLAGLNVPSMSMNVPRLAMATGGNVGVMQQSAAPAINLTINTTQPVDDTFIRRKIIPELERIGRLKA